MLFQVDIGLLRPHPVTMVSAGHLDRARWGAVTVAVSVGAGFAAATSPSTVAILVAAVAVCAALLRPRLILAGFAMAAFLAEWLFDAHRVGYIPIPSPVASVATWAILLIAAAYLTVKVRFTVADLAVAIYTGGVAFTVLVGAIRGVGGSYYGVQSILLAATPVAVGAIITNRWTINGAVRALAWLTIAEAVYSLIQKTQLRFGTSYGFFTIGSDTRWWSSSAVYGTFTTEGTHVFGRAAVLLMAALLPWAIRSDDRGLRRLCLVASGLIGCCVLLSEARAALLSAALVVLLAVHAARSVKAALLLALCAAVIYPVAAHSIHQLQARGVLDHSANVRLAIWDQLSNHPSPAWLVGTGYNSVGPELTAAGIMVVQPGKSKTTDNLYFRKIIEGGLIGLGSLVAFLFMLARVGWRSTTTGALMARGLVVAVGVQSLTSDALFFDEAMAVAALCLGLLAATLRAETRGLDL